MHTRIRAHLFRTHRILYFGPVAGFEQLDVGRGYGYFRMAQPPLFLAVFHQPPALEDAAKMKPILEREARLAEGKLGLAVLVVDGTDPPPKPVRQQFTAALESIGKDSVGVVCIVEGSGVWKAAMRSLSSVIVTMSGLRVPTKIVGSSEEGLRWLLPKTDVGTSSSPAIITSIEQARAHTLDWTE